ncbi:uncharacterized protein MELLADRAFT_39474, partial [Melampsora larici-populina 98AG31]
NPVGVQLLPRPIHKQVFPIHSFRSPDPRAIKLSQSHLNRHGLASAISPALPAPSFLLPTLQGETIDDHFQKLGHDRSEPYLSISKRFTQIQLPSAPTNWAHQPGWTIYHSDGSFESIEYPPIHHDALVFDVETLPSHTHYAIMATAVTRTNWFSWLSPWLLSQSDQPDQLIPMPSGQQPRLIIGHHVGFDRARISDEHSLERSTTRFMDTMSLHIATYGLSNPQRPAFVISQRSKKEATPDGSDIPPSTAEDQLNPSLGSKQSTLAQTPETQAHGTSWTDVSSMNSLDQVARLHCGIQLDKSTRNAFLSWDRPQIVAHLSQLLDYCSVDVSATHAVFSKLLPIFLEQCPHPVSFAGMLHMGNPFLPVDETWERFLERAESTYAHKSSGVKTSLLKLAEATRKLMFARNPATGRMIYEDDHWLKQLDWNPKKARWTELKSQDPTKPVLRDDKPTLPAWFADLRDSNDKKISLTTKSQITPLLLRLSFLGFPLYRSRQHGWTFRIPLDQLIEPYLSRCPLVFSCELDPRFVGDQSDAVYFKLPHPSGDEENVGSPLGKSFDLAFENGVLQATPFKKDDLPTSGAREAVSMNMQCSYWLNASQRIKTQMVVWRPEESKKKIELGTQMSPTSLERLEPEKRKQGIILPQVTVMGTVTRRATEKTWLAAANAKKNKIGTELKSMVRAPPGYAIVGADVDSEELWISSVMGDAQFGMHGATAIGWMTLEGTKSAGTDLHSKTATILGISRNEAKVFNYSRIYGAGVTHAIQLLMKADPKTSKEEANQLAKKLYRSTKGLKNYRSEIFERRFWYGGTESFLFNKLEEIALDDEPKTPALGCGITRALRKAHLPTKSVGIDGGPDFMTSRVNWAVQSSGVDYLHLLIVAMDYLIDRYGIQARYMISVHDEIRYLSVWEDRYRTGLALQIANLWTRCQFAFKLEMDDLPQSCAWFSAVDVDHVLRKEVDLSCVTPSNPNPIPPGESLDIETLLKRLPEGLGDVQKPLGVLDELFKSADSIKVNEHRSENLEWLEAQASSDQDEVKRIWESIRKPRWKREHGEEHMFGNKVWEMIRAAERKDDGLNWDENRLGKSQIRKRLENDRVKNKNKKKRFGLELELGREEEEGNEAWKRFDEVRRASTTTPSSEDDGKGKTLQTV